MCKANNITQTLLNEKKHCGFNKHDMDNLSECEIGNCNECKKEICWENDYISACQMCKLEICIDCKEITLCDLCFGSFCKSCRPTVEINDFTFCVDCNTNQENEFYYCIVKGNYTMTMKLLEKNYYSSTFIDIMFINSLHYHNLKIISLLFENLSNQNGYTCMAFNSFITRGPSINNKNDYIVLKFLLTKSSRSILQQSINYFTNHPEYKISNDILEFIDMILIS